MSTASCACSPPAIIIASMERDGLSMDMMIKSVLVEILESDVRG